MIHRIRSDSPSFKEVHFSPGLNLVVAERSAGSAQRDSRNGLGKTTLVEIIHFCLGSRLSKGRGLAVPSLSDWSFTVDLDLAGTNVEVTRSLAAPNRVVVDGDLSSWPEAAQTQVLDRQRSFRVDEWTQLLGQLMFGLPLVSERPFSPSFRSLVSYFARREPSGFLSPFEHFSQQPTWDRQVSNAFLLGLAWEDASDWQVLRQRRQELEDLRRLARAEVMQDVLGSVGELEVERLRLEQQVSGQAARLRSFQVHPEYREIEQRASALTSEIHEAGNANVVDRQKRRYYLDSFGEAEADDDQDVVDIYEQAGVALPGAVRRTLDEVRAFHAQLVSNRRQYLANEVEDCERRIREREARIQVLTAQRADLLGILATHGALDEYTRLQGLHNETVGRLNAVQNRLAILRREQELREQVQLDQVHLEKRARLDYEERRAQREAAVSLFNEYSQFLYSAPGNLVIDLSPTGFQFNVEIARSGSHGISNMKILCYDMLLASIWSGRDPRSAFLVHDSPIFDGVDERQVALALQLAARESEVHGFQYVAMFNSDQLPRNDLPADFDLDGRICLRLSDATEDGGVLGVRF